MEPTAQATKKRKIMFVITKSNFGGAQRYVYDLATNLDKTTYDVSVAFGGIGTPHSQPGTLARMLEEAGVRTHFVSSLGRDISVHADIAATQELIQLFKKEKPHIVHLNSSKVGGIGALAGRVAHIPTIIYTAHGWAFWEDRNPLAQIVIRIISWITALLSHRVICISRHDAAEASWMFGARSKISILRNGIEIFNTLNQVQARNKLFSPEVQHAHRDDFWLVSNGELHPNKNYLYALDAVEQYNLTHSKKIFYTIIGEGQQRGAIEAHIQQHELNKHVHMLGFVPDARTYLKAFDALFLPSQKEGVPYVILESGIARVPVIASNVGGIPEVLQPVESPRAHGILIDPHTIESGVHALEHMVHDRDVRYEYADNLAEHVLRTYSMERMLVETTKLYTS